MSLANELDIGTGTIAVLTVFAIGFLVGIVLKKTFKLGIAIISLVAFLAATGYINLQLSDTTKTTIYRAFSQTPSIASKASSLASILPITSGAFLIGLALGIWKG
jgi:uncharacterized membrane protein (Fun14 family)